MKANEPLRRAIQRASAQLEMLATAYVNTDAIEEAWHVRGLVDRLTASLLPDEEKDGYFTERLKEAQPYKSHWLKGWEGGGFGDV